MSLGNRFWLSFAENFFWVHEKRCSYWRFWQAYLWYDVCRVFLIPDLRSMTICIKLLEKFTYKSICEIITLIWLHINKLMKQFNVKSNSNTDRLFDWLFLTVSFKICCIHNYFFENSCSNRRQWFKFPHCLHLRKSFNGEVLLALPCVF